MTATSTQDLRVQMQVTQNERGWIWTTNGFCSSQILPSKLIALGDFSLFLSSIQPLGVYTSLSSQPANKSEGLSNMAPDKVEDRNLYSSAKKQVSGITARLEATFSLLSDPSDSGRSETSSNLEFNGENDYNLFVEVDDLEGSLSRSAMNRLRAQVQSEGKGFGRYVQLMRVELYGESQS